MLFRLPADLPVPLCDLRPALACDARSSADPVAAARRQAGKTRLKRMGIGWSIGH